MDKERYEEAEIILRFNLERYPDSWNVYDSMGELQLKMGNMGIAEGLYVKSLDLNPDNISAKNALRKLKEHTTNKIQ
jgi:tetratricopeptide (TPR) repeat protein